MLAKTGRYRLTWRTDPATSMTIGFEFSLGRNVYVAYDTQNGGINPSAYRYRVSPAVTTIAKGMRTCFVRLSALQPETVYYFLVVDDQGISKPMSFETPPNRRDRALSIIAGGDSRNHRAARQNANRIVSRLRPHAVFFSGDMTNGDTPKEWADWLDDWQLTISPDGRCYPIVTARGNHEKENESIAKLFDTPHPDNYYALGFGGGLLRLYTLNSMFHVNGAQLNWLESDLLAHPDVGWKIAQYHNAMRPHAAAKPDKDELAKYWAPVFYRYGMNLVVESDAHVVKRTWPIRPGKGPGSDEGFIRDDLRGTVYIGEGCWGAPLRNNDDEKSWTRASGRFHQFKWIWVDSEKIEVRTVMTDQSSNCGSVAPNRRFYVPSGLKLWQADGNPVLTIRKAGRQATATTPATTPRPNNRPPPPRRQPPTIGNGGSSPVPGGRPVRPAPTAEATALRPNGNFKVQIEYTLAQPGPVEFIIITDQMRQFYKGQLPAKGPGPYREWLQIPEIPRGIKWQLILKSRGQVIRRYHLVN